MGRYVLGSRLTVAVFGAVLIAFSVQAFADVAPPGETRDRLTFNELMAAEPDPDGPIHNDYFMPVGETGPAHHDFNGVLEVPQATPFSVPGLFPDFSSAFITVDDHLVPVERDFMRSLASQWTIILSPGRVWSEPGDHGWSRASFPFVLAGRNWGDSHNGLATFLFNDTQVSNLQIQIVQESSPSWRFDVWSRVPLTYLAGPVDHQDDLAAAYAEELSLRLPTQPLTALDVESALLADMESGFQHLTATGLLHGGVLYVSACRTRYGAYPYCDEMRHTIWSATKSAAAALTLLWLAQAYGPEVLDLKIVDYVDVTASHDGWREVTFLDAIDMATGVGGMAPDRYTTEFVFARDNERNISQFASAATTEQKLDIAFAASNYDWGPGEVGRYNNKDTFVLAVAMDAFLKSVEGPDVNLWDHVTKEVLEPIGIRSAPLMHTRELDGSRGTPTMDGGLLPTINDLARIAQLFQNRGAFEDRQLLYAEEIDMLLEGNPDSGLRINLFNAYGEYSYDFSFAYVPHTTPDGCHVRIPIMAGRGGNIVAFMPNDMVGIRLADEDDDAAGSLEIEGMAALADSMRPFCSG